MAIRQSEYYCCHYLHRTMHEVHIINGFTSNSSMPLVIWCKSNQGDLGGHALREDPDLPIRSEEETLSQIKQTKVDLRESQNGSLVLWVLSCQELERHTWPVGRRGKRGWEE
ncbi:hypothetical protein RJ639_045906 [Escallonia herrerae]|uniref:Uncharacterized protein n=1 Tax=Escallonia herrerae TaxID=1293975 RepID=A0AA89AZV1_9ASTE|nr:hypothetical protein RJ639_045906 [Escallonia herrerae]